MYYSFYNYPFKKILVDVRINALKVSQYTLTHTPRHYKSVTLEIMFIPMASPVLEWKRMYRFLPARPTSSFWSRANLPTATTLLTLSHKNNVQTRHATSTCVHVRFHVLPAGAVKGLFDVMETICALQPGLDLSSLAGRGQPHYRSSSHAVSQDTTAGSTSQLQHTGDRATSQIHYMLRYMLPHVTA